jgi:hypothetical protein
MRLSAALLFVAVLSGCAAPADRPAAVATAEPASGWRWTGPEVALVGRNSGVVFERAGAVEAIAPAKTVRIKARCVDCSPPSTLEFDAVTPTVKYDLGPGIAESINATVVFPAAGTWAFEPLGGQVTVRSPTSTQPALVVVRPWSKPLSADCGAQQIENAVSRFARAFNSGSPGDLAQSLNPLVDFSVHGEPLAVFATKDRKDVGDYIRARFLAGETIHPYLVHAASIGDNAIDLMIYFVRTAPDLPPGSKGHSYRRAAARSRLFCYDRLLLRFNAALLSD